MAGTDERMWFSYLMFRKPRSREARDLSRVTHGSTGTMCLAITTPAWMLFPALRAS